LREGELWVVLDGIKHAGKTSIRDHLNIDQLFGPVRARLVVYGGVEADDIVGEVVV
jgi:hypothetical protein